MFLVFLCFYNGSIPLSPLSTAQPDQISSCMYYRCNSAKTLQRNAYPHLTERDRLLKSQTEYLVEVQTPHSTCAENMRLCIVTRQVPMGILDDRFPRVFQ